jgi:menaquinol-cytochrome c reductase cytochrome b/c subunit
VNRGQQEYYKRDYAQAKKEGKPFFPYAVYKDLVIATLAIGIVIALSIVHRVEVGEPVNPASTDFVPRPEWYFFFLFELLKIFKGQNALMPVIMATFIIPNILMLLLIITPFIDRGPERRIQKRPIALISGVAVIFFLAYLTNLGASSNEGVGAEGLPITVDDPTAKAGEALFLANGCTSCHQIAGVGAPGPGPNLTDEGTKGNPPEYYEGFLKDPPGNVMPSFTTFTPEQYNELGTFLSGLGTEYK